MKSKLLLLFLLAYFIYGSVLVIGSQSGFTANMNDGHLFPYLADKPVGEDGYYMLTVAWNLAEGRGLVYTYDIQTTEIQPLTTFLFGGIAWIVQVCGGDKWVFVRAILAFGMILLPIFAHLIGRLARQLPRDKETREKAYLAGFVLTFFNIELFRWFTYGLETGIYLVLMAFTFLIFANPTAEKTIRIFIGWGILVGLTCLARIDFIVVFLLLLLIAFIQDRTKIVAYVTTGMVSFMVVLPWFFYVYSVTGSWIPSSGGAQASFLSNGTIGIGGRILASTIAFFSYLFPWIMPKKHILLLLGSIILTSMLIFWLSRQNTVGKLRLDLKQKPILSAWFAAIPILVLIYPAFFWAWHFYPRYFAPISIPVYVCLAVLIAKKLRSASRWVNPILYILTSTFFFFWAIVVFHTKTIDYTFPVTTNYIQQHFSTAKVGAFQSGTAGFFNPNVINLDGKVNHEALTYRQNNASDQYIEQENIDILID